MPFPQLQGLGEWWVVVGLITLPNIFMITPLQETIVTIGTGITILGYLEIRLNNLEKRIDKLTDQYIHHLEMHLNQQ